MNGSRPLIHLHRESRVHRLVREVGHAVDIPNLTVLRLAGYVVGTAAALWVIWALLVVVIVVGSPS